MLFLRRQLLTLLRGASPSPLPFPIHRRACLLSTTSEATAPFSLEDCLVASCGLSPAQARKTAKKAFQGVSKESKKAFEELSFCRLNSASNPDAVLAVLSSVGLARADIASIVAADPLILRSSVNKIEPRLLALRDRVGLSPPQMARLLLTGSRALRCGDIESNVLLLISFYGSFEKVLAAAKRNRAILAVRPEKVIEPNIALLRQFGVRDIVRLCSIRPWLLTFHLERVKELLLRAQELGVPPTSRMFKNALAAVAGISKDNVAAKLEFFKRTLACSDYEVSFAVSTAPAILGLSQENLLRKIEFLVNKVGMEPKLILNRPLIIAYSLEKRLIPRHNVMKVLQAKGLLIGDMSFYTFARLGEKTFKVRFIDCHKDSVTGLADAYAADCAGGVPLGN